MGLASGKVSPAVVGFAIDIPYNDIKLVKLIISVVMLLISSVDTAH